MSVTFPLDSAIGALRTIIKNTWAATTYIPESAIYPVVSSSFIPYAIIDISECEIEDGKPGINEVTQIYPIEVHYITRVQSGVNTIQTLRDKAESLISAVFASPTLGGVVSRVKSAGYSFGRNSLPMKEIIASGQERYIAGCTVKFKVEVIESKLS